MTHSPELKQLLATLDPELMAGTFVFASLRRDQRVDVSDLVACIREREGLSVVMEASRAQALGIEATFPCAWIALRVHSELSAVGLTAAFAQTLAGAGISCNVVAGTLHDHIFVPIAAAEAAMNELRALQRRSAA